MLNKNQVQELITKVNAEIKSECPGFTGEFSILDDDDDNLTDNCYNFTTTFDPNIHYVVDYNFDDDEARDVIYVNGKRCHIREAEFNKVWNKFDALCQLVYGVNAGQVDEVDGSGNGLYYGSMMFTK